MLLAKMSQLPSKVLHCTDARGITSLQPFSIYVRLLNSHCITKGHKFREWNLGGSQEKKREKLWDIQSVVMCPRNDLAELLTSAQCVYLTLLRQRNLQHPKESTAMRCKRAHRHTIIYEVHGLKCPQLHVQYIPWCHCYLHCCSSCTRHLLIQAHFFYRLLHPNTDKRSNKITLNNVIIKL